MIGQTTSSDHCVLCPDFRRMSCDEAKKLKSSSCRLGLSPRLLGARHRGLVGGAGGSPSSREMLDEGMGVVGLAEVAFLGISQGQAS